MPYQVAWAADDLPPNPVGKQAHQDDKYPWEPETVSHLADLPEEAPSAHQQLHWTLQIRAALPAQIMFMPRAWYTELPSVQTSGLWSDHGNSPNNSQVIQEAWTGAD